MMEVEEDRESKKGSLCSRHPMLGLGNYCCKCQRGGGGAMGDETGEEGEDQSLDFFL